MSERLAIVLSLATVAAVATGLSFLAWYLLGRSPRGGDDEVHGPIDEGVEAEDEG